MIFNEISTVLKNSEISHNIYEAHLSSSIISKESRPGQFINILPSETFDKTMRRPMSISYQDDNMIKIIYKPIGDGTRIMRDWTNGDQVNIIGPLGNSWTYKEEKDILLIGGGVGIAPIMNLYDKIKDNIKTTLFIGARIESEHFLNHQPDKNIYISTDDGSVGIKGNLFEAINSIYTLDQLKQKTLYVCGPPMMMESIRIFTVKHNIKCYLALETIMACGIGICQGCTVEKHINDDSKDTYRNRYELICMDGPIYKSNEIKTCLL